MSKEVSWLVTNENVTVRWEGQSHIVSRGTPLADDLIAALKDGRKDEIPELISVASRIKTFSKGNFVVDKGRVLINGVEAPRVLSDRIVQFSNEGLPFQPLLKFAENLQQNPSFRAVNELFQFLEKNNHPLTENGCFIAYKKVRSDFKDAYTGTFDNSVGETPSMPRNQVNEDPTQTCSDGLHVANWHYAANVYSAETDAIMIEVEVNPADVVAVPVDYDQAKMRCCKYKVLSVVTQPHNDNVALRVTSPSYTEEEEEPCYYCGETDCTYCDECDSECGNNCDCDRSEASLDDDDEEEEEEYPYEDEIEGE
jgi:hypothetical protein